MGPEAKSSYNIVKFENYDLLTSVLRLKVMEKPKTRKSAVLYQNRHKTVTLIDIPFSITLAQMLAGEDVIRHLLSNTPPSNPYPSTEPKSDIARKNVLSRLTSESIEHNYLHLIENALEEVGAQNGDLWHLPRHLSPFGPSKELGKRKLHEESDVSEPVIPTSLSLSRKPLLNLVGTSSNTFVSLQSLADRLVLNPTDKATTIEITSNSSPAIYHIPPGASFHLSSLPLTQLTSFATALHPTPSSTAAPGQFDLITMDPPWHNRSVRRSRKYSTARPSDSTNDDTFAFLIDTLYPHIAPEGLVGCWTTNSSTVRTQVEAAFKAWDVDLIEEWVWVKVTTKGQPVGQLDGLWRKPYELFLLGRRAGESDASNMSSSIQRRVLVGVPDVHSRKPCLKQLLGPYFEGREYRALEIFARVLTAGWGAWGNECLKFNWDGHWTQDIAIRPE